LRDFQNRARDYALKLLSYRGRSERELEERLLKKGIATSETSSTIRYLKEIGLVDDMSLAETLKRETLNRRLLSQSGAKKYMLSRGIPRGIVDLVFSCHEDTDFANALQIIEKKRKVLGKYPQAVARRRLYGFLQRRGYSSETIMKVLRDGQLKEED
jgi:regulatory protein